MNVPEARFFALRLSDAFFINEYSAGEMNTDE